jgi:hypothetical protein
VQSDFVETFEQGEGRAGKNNEVALDNFFPKT